MSVQGEFSVNGEEVYVQDRDHPYGKERVERILPECILVLSSHCARHACFPIKFHLK